MSTYSMICYFMIGNINTHQEIGNYLNKDLKDNNFENVKFTCDDIFRNSSDAITNNRKNKIILDYYIIFSTLKNSGTFYLAVVYKNSLYEKEEHLIFELFEDIDHQGIKKLVNSRGILTQVGMLNLKFSLELYQENNRKNINKNNYNENDIGKYKDSSKIALLNNEIKDIHSNVKETVKNMINNVNDIQDLDDKSEKIKDSSFQYKKDLALLEQQMKYKKFFRKFFIYSVICIIFLIILYFIFK